MQQLAGGSRAGAGQGYGAFSGPGGLGYPGATTTVRAPVNVHSTGALPQAQQTTASAGFPVGAQNASSLDILLGGALSGQQRQQPSVGALGTSTPTTTFSLTTMDSLLHVVTPQALNTGEPYTLFSPTDEAFELLRQQDPSLYNSMLNDPDVMRRTVLYHIAPRIALTSTAIASTPIPLTPSTDSGTNLVVYANAETGLTHVNNAFVVDPDITVPGNLGIVHVIDRVLIPNDPVPPVATPVIPGNGSGGGSGGMPPWGQWPGYPTMPTYPGNGTGGSPPSDQWPGYPGAGGGQNGGGGGSGGGGGNLAPPNAPEGTITDEPGRVSDTEGNIIVDNGNSNGGGGLTGGQYGSLMPAAATVFMTPAQIAQIAQSSWGGSNGAPGAAAVHAGSSSAQRAATAAYGTAAGGTSRVVRPF